jgi:peroxiredoxin
MPDLEALSKQFQPQGLVVLAISDEESDKVVPFIKEHGFTYSILLDPGNKVHAAYLVEGIPHSFVYNREGAIVAQSIDMRTREQFLAMLSNAGLHK